MLGLYVSNTKITASAKAVRFWGGCLAVSLADHLDVSPSLKRAGV